METYQLDYNIMTRFFELGHRRHKTIQPNPIKLTMKQNPETQIAFHLADESSKTGETTDKNETIDANAYFISKVTTAVRKALDHNHGQAVPWEGDYPSIDISPWLIPVAADQDRLAREEVVQKIVQEATTSGSFHITGHGVPLSVLEALESTSRNFFALSLAEKQQFYNPEHRRGYTELQSESVANVYGYETKTSEKADLRECYSVVYPPSSAANAQAPDAYQQALEQYMEHMHRLDTALHRILTAAMKLLKQVPVSDDLLDSAKGDAQGVLRSTYFPALGEEFDDATRLFPHSDWGTVTIIRSQHPGLEEIRHGQWIHVPALHPNQLHVILGEMLSIWSNGAFVANVHRVGWNFDGDRTSHVYFCGQGGGTENGGIDPVRREDEEPLFGRLSTNQHVKAYTGRFLSKKTVQVVHDSREIPTK